MDRKKIIDGLILWPLQIFLIFIRVIHAVFIITYIPGAFVTWVYLTFFDGYPYNWWNWILVLPINWCLAMIWPVYWAIIRPVFGF